MPGADDVVDFVVALVEHAARIHPPLDVAAAIQARHAHVFADGKRHGAAGAADLVGDLDAGCRSAHDQHAAGIELRRIAILQRRKAGNVRRQGRRHLRNGRQVAGAGGEHD